MLKFLFKRILILTITVSIIFINNIRIENNYNSLIAIPCYTWTELGENWLGRLVLDIEFYYNNTKYTSIIGNIPEDIYLEAINSNDIITSHDSEYDSYIRIFINKDNIDKVYMTNKPSLIDQAFQAWIIISISSAIETLVYFLHRKNDKVNIEEEISENG